MTTIAYPLRIPEEILFLAEMRAREEHVDKATSLRQLLHLGAEEYLLQLVGGGRLSVGRAAELLGVSVQDIHRLAAGHGVEIGATASQRAMSRTTVNRLLLAQRKR